MGPASLRRPVRAVMGLRPSSCASRSADAATACAALENLGDAGPGQCDEHDHDRAVAADGKQRTKRRACEPADHERTANTGSICASMWKRSPGSDGALVVGAKKVARVKLRRLLHQPDQARRIACDADHAQLVALDAQLGHVGVVGQELRQHFQHDHAGRRSGTCGAPARAAASPQVRPRGRGGWPCAARRCGASVLPARWRASSPRARRR